MSRASSRWLELSVERGRSILCAAVRLAHQLISGSSMTACHNPACTVQTIEETGSHFLPARKTPIVSSSCPSPRSRPAGPKPGKPLWDYVAAAIVWCCLSHNGAVGYQARFDIAPERDRQLSSQGNQHDAPDPRRLICGLAGIPVRQGTAGLVFPPEPCDFDEDASVPSCCRPWRSPGTASSSRCRRRSVSDRGRSRAVGDWRIVARRPRAPGSLHWRHPPLAERTAFLFSARPLDLAHRLYRAPFDDPNWVSTSSRRWYSRSSSRRRRSASGTPSAVASMPKSIRVRRRFGSIPRMPWAKSRPLMRLIWPVRSRTRRWRSR